MITMQSKFQDYIEDLRARAEVEISVGDDIKYLQFFSALDGAQYALRCLEHELADAVDHQLDLLEQYRIGFEDGLKRGLCNDSNSAVVAAATCAKADRTGADD